VFEPITNPWFYLVCFIGYTFGGYIWYHEAHSPEEARSAMSWWSFWFVVMAVVAFGRS
jgi:hypothetical protein